MKIFVGKNRKLYNIHKTLLTSHCPFFAKCLNPSFPEGRSNEIGLEDENIETFDHFFQWIYSQEVRTDTNFRFGAFYVLADKFCMEALKNNIVDALITYCKKHPVPFEEVDPLMNHNLSNSPFIKAMLKQVTSELVTRHQGRYSKDDGRLRTLGSLFADTKVMREFLGSLDRSISLQERAGNGDPFELGLYERCTSFHEHKETSKCKVSDGDENQTDDSSDSSNIGS